MLIGHLCVLCDLLALFIKMIVHLYWLIVLNLLIVGNFKHREGLYRSP